MFPTHPLFRRYENELTVGEQKLEWTTLGRDFFFRPAQGHMHIVWCQPSHQEIPYSFRHFKRHQRASQVIRKEFEKRTFWRFFSMENGREFLLSLDFVLMRYRGAAFWLRLDWQTSLYRDFGELMLDKIKMASWLEDCLKVSQGDWEAAVRCREKGDWWNRVECTQGSIEQLQQLVDAYVLLWNVHIRNHSVRDLRFKFLLRPFWNATPEVQLTTQRISALLDTHFRIEVKNIVRRTYADSGKSSERLSFHKNPPYEISQHERLEALLLWRDFLRDKMPLEEIEALLKI